MLACFFVVGDYFVFNGGNSLMWAMGYENANCRSVLNASELKEQMIDICRTPKEDCATFCLQEKRFPFMPYR